ncbi:MAG: glycosyltransferase, partial [Bacteroidales bacterium]
MGGVEIWDCGLGRSRVHNMIVSAKAVLTKAVALDADVYQVSELELLKVGLSLRKKGSSVIFHLREDYPNLILGKSYVPRIFRKPLSLFVARILRRMLPKYDIIFPVTTKLVDDLKKQSIKNVCLLANYPVINNGFSLTFDQYCEREIIMVYFGTIYRVSRQETVFDALSRLPQLTYLLMGKMEDLEYSEQLRHHPYWSRVSFIDGFNHEEMSAIVNRARFSNVLRDFAQAGMPEGSLGVLKMFESMEAALPIVCSDVKINRWIIEKYRCGLCVDPNDPEAICEAVRYLIS